mmetsp:Transcript_32988/g.58007  ORF Transcript_32988/g.58007 Transcript_32988/m.58007 type:complete len:327 (-) Transcript_32988:1523-2503(-)|eukprot:CAMPEP_0204906982 /NCGR_PEP_ID=MMETSP1397-20131031/6260_1 /ASSEMBLY_ACC=CAM_ASM_000891 /TAXON_ID=49980 /ORGANISM="Climacostomum Climacostomum virens, Strain Stock W-24" /LENGTH=326 /DNA_ID=CAMNT_0052075993 /DNA_START=237 /DNA_END=1217 /DNA_ORIENTATION=-
MEQDSLKQFLAKKDEELQKLRSELASLTTTHSKQAVSMSQSTPFYLPMASSKCANPRVKSKAKTSFTVPVVTSDVGERIKQAFLKYAGPSNFTLTQTNYRKFLADVQVYKVIPKVLADLEFFKDNVSKVINFNQFLRILASLSRRFYPSTKTDEAFARFAREHIIQNLRDSQMQTEINAVKQLALSPEAKQTLAAYHGTISRVFQAYMKSSPETNDSLHLNEFLLFLNQFCYIPDIMSTTQAAAFFRTAQHYMSFDDFINRTQFENCILLMALWGCREDSISESIARWFKYIEVSPDLLRSVGLMGAHTKFIGFTEEDEEFYEARQ